VLEDGSEHLDLSASGEAKEDGWVGDAKLSTAGGNLIDGVHIGGALLEGNGKTDVPVVALIDGGVVARKLELVKPFELKGDGYERGGGGALFTPVAEGGEGGEEEEQEE
jgi:hypothetical protein